LPETIAFLAMSMKDLCEIIEVQQRRLHNARKERLHKFGLSPIGESRWKAGRDALLPTALFVPPGASVLPEVPHPGNSGAPVRILSREDIARLDPDLQAYLVNAGQFGARNGDENERCADVVLSVLEGPGGVQYDDSEGELAQHGHWYQYLSNESWPDSATGLSARAYPARRPKRAKNIKALYVTGNTIDMDFDSLVSCLVTLPPKMVQSKDILKGPMDEDDTRTAAVSAIEVLARGPCHGPYTLLLHNAIVDKHALEKVAQALMVIMCMNGVYVYVSLCIFFCVTEIVLHSAVEPAFTGHVHPRLCHFLQQLAQFSCTQNTGHSAELFQEKLPSGLDTDFLEQHRQPRCQLHILCSLRMRCPTIVESEQQHHW
jgi:hypothetical protein